MHWPEVTLRLALIAALSAAIVCGVSVWITAPLSLLATAATAELAIRPYANNMADRLLLSCGAIVTILIIAGIALNLTPWGLTQTTWGATWLAVSIGVLICRRGTATGVPRLPSEMRSLSLWGAMALAAVIIVGAVTLALAGVRRSAEQPDLAFSLISKSTNSVVVEVEATSFSGSYYIVTASSGSAAHQYSSPLLTIRAGGAGERVRERIPINGSGTWTIDLDSAHSGTTVRRLKVNFG